MGSSIDKTPLNYFLLMYPPDVCGRTVAATNAYALTQGVDLLFTTNEYYKFIGIKLAYAIHPIPGGIYKGGFGTINDENGVFLAGNYGARFGMSRNRMKKIHRYLTFITHTAEDKIQVHPCFHHKYTCLHF